MLAVWIDDRGPWWAAHGSRLLLIDPPSGRVIRRVALTGGIDDAAALQNGTVAVLMSRRTMPTVVLMRPNGESHVIRLPRLNLRGGSGLRVGGQSFSPDRQAGMATDGVDRVFVVVAIRSHS